MITRRLVLAVALTAAVASGTYVFVYLYRWEWHRALVAGVIFVAAEVGLGLILVFERLRRIERRLDAAAPRDDLEGVLRHIEDAEPPPTRPFRWLAEGDRLGVFVPILLGAGVVMSAAAWGIERIARASAGPALERNLAVRLAPLSFPEGCLTGAPAPLPLRRSVGGPARTAAVVLATGVVVAGMIDVLADLTQDRPDAVAGLDGVSVVTLAVDSKAHYDDGGTLAVAETVWTACTSQLRQHKVPPMTSAGNGLVQATVSPALGPNALERLRGCLNDATIDRLSLNVVSVQVVEP